MHGRTSDAIIRVLDLADRQGGVFHRRQALECGVSRRASRLRIQTREWRPFAGMLACGPVPDHDRALAWAAFLAAGPESVVSGPLAMRLWGMECHRSDPMVIIPVGRHTPVHVGRTLRVPCAREHRTNVDGLPITVPDRALVDTLMRLRFRDAARVLDRSLQLRYTDAGRLRWWCAQMRRRHGVVQLRFLAERARDRTWSQAERKAVRLLQRAGIQGFTVNHEVHDVNGVLVAVIDIAFPEQRVAIEIDGFAFHSAPQEFQRDRTRQNLLVRHGWRKVLRFTWDDLTARPQYVINEIRFAVGSSV